MKILIVNRFFGGAQIPTGRMAEDVARVLVEEGHEVTALASTGTYAGAAKRSAAYGGRKGGIRGGGCCGVSVSRMTGESATDYRNTVIEHRNTGPAAHTSRGASACAEVDAAGFGLGLVYLAGAEADSADGLGCVCFDDGSAAFALACGKGKSGGGTTGPRDHRTTGRHTAHCGLVDGSLSGSFGGFRADWEIIRSTSGILANVSGRWVRATFCCFWGKRSGQGDRKQVSGNRMRGKLLRGNRGQVATGDRSQEPEAVRPEPRLGEIGRQGDQIAQRQTGGRKRKSRKEAQETKRRRKAVRGRGCMKLKN